MEFRAIGLIELNSVAQGILVADEMLKASDVDLIMARSACPGRYLAMVAGDVGAVQNAVEVGRQAGGRPGGGQLCHPQRAPGGVPRPERDQPLW